MPTWTLYPDIDARIVSSAPDTNYGTLASEYVGDLSTSVSQIQRSLIKPDLSSIPASLFVTDAQLRLWEKEAQDTASVGSWAVELHCVLRAWTESGVTYNKWDGSNAWTTAGCGSDGADRDATVLASLTLDGTPASDFVTWDSAALAAWVQSVLRGTVANYGLLIIAPSAEAKGTTNQCGNGFASSDHATSAWHPQFIVSGFTPVDRVAWQEG